MIYVIANNARLAEHVARGRVERRSDYRYVHDQQQLYGVQEAEVFVYTIAGRGSQRYYPHGPLEEARRRSQQYPDTFKIHYLDESDLQ